MHCKEVFNSMLHFTSTYCTELHCTALFYLKQYKPLLHSSGLLRTRLQYSTLHLTILYNTFSVAVFLLIFLYNTSPYFYKLGSISPNWFFIQCTGLYFTMLGCISLYWALPHSTRLYWAVLWTRFFVATNTFHFSLHPSPRYSKM